MILRGEALDKLKELEDDSVDLICTDPPYGYSFMGKDWDKVLPDIEIFKECLRVMKPGAFAFIMAAPRQDVLSRMMILLEDAGFSMNFSSMYWTYASGFPKANNISKVIDKKFGAKREKYLKPIAYPDSECWGVPNKNERKGYDATSYNTKPEKYMKQNGMCEDSLPATPEAKQFDGAYGGFQPKPAVEVIIVAQKPMTEPTQAGQALDNGKGCTWLDDCRIPYADDSDKDSAKPGGKIRFHGTHENNKEIQYRDNDTFKPTGRFPANLIISDDVLDDGKEYKGWSSQNHNKFNPYGGNSLLETDTERKGFHKGYNDSGTFSRFFSLDAWAERNLPFLIVPKASKKEKNGGLDQMETKSNIWDGCALKQKWCKNCGKRFDSCKCGNYEEELRDVFTPAYKNNHPTVKPIKLMSYLITMGSRKGDVVLDCFAGSGTTGCAAEMLGRDYILIEMDPEYVEIAKARLKYWSGELL